MAYTMRYISWAEVDQRITRLPQGRMWGIPRGGTIVARLSGRMVLDIQEADFIVDDIIDSGKTLEKYEKEYGKRVYALIDKRKDKKEWVCFPWENPDPLKDAEDNVIRLLEYFGEDLGRIGLQQTPKRFVQVLAELLTPIDFECTAFPSEGYDQMIASRNISFFSLCEHHILPFFGVVHIGYIPGKDIIGLSKLARTVEYFAHRLNTQEYLTQNIANFLEEKLHPAGLGVMIKARHLCQEIRGVRKQGEMITTCLKGTFFDQKVRDEFLQLCES